MLISLLLIFTSGCTIKTKKVIVGTGKEFSGTICIGKTFKPGLITEADAPRVRRRNGTGTKVQMQIENYERVKISPREWSLMRGLRLGKTYTVRVFNYQGTKKLLTFKVKIPKNRPHVFIEQKASFGTWGYVALSSIAEECINGN